MWVGLRRVLACVLLVGILIIVIAPEVDLDPTVLRTPHRLASIHILESALVAVASAGLSEATVSAVLSQSSDTRVSSSLESTSVLRC